MGQGQRSMPIIQVRDVDASADFYRDVFGFSVAGKWNNDDGSANFSIVQLDSITLGLSHDADATGTGENWAAYLYIADVAAFADHAIGQGAEPSRAMVEQFYGCRDIEFTDLDGNRICFGQDLTPGDGGPGL